MTSPASPLSDGIEQALDELVAHFPKWTGEEAKKKMCPMLSSIDDSGQVRKFYCMTNACVHWDWIVEPQYLRFPESPSLWNEPGMSNTSREGYGRCCLPRFIAKGAICDIVKLYQDDGN